MKTLWTYIDRKPWREETKYRTAFLIHFILSVLAGLVVWLVVRTWAFSSPDWMICFLGYPALIVFHIDIIYAYRHAFHNGIPVE